MDRNLRDLREHSRYSVGSRQKYPPRASKSLPEGERECLLLSEFNGMKYAEISEILSIPVGTVKSRMFSAVQRLKEGLKDLRPEA